MQGQLKTMLEFLETMDAWYSSLSRLPLKAIIKFVKMGARIPKLLGLAS